MNIKKTLQILYQKGRRSEKRCLLKNKINISQVCIWKLSWHTCESFSENILAALLCCLSFHPTSVQVEYVGRYSTTLLLRDSKPATSYGEYSSL